jgi:translation elongation factor EF-G
MALAKEYTTDKIRNVVVLGHGGAGKTDLIDALCFTAGTSKRKGNVSEGSALTMYTPEEASMQAPRSISWILRASWILSARL